MWWSQLLGGTALQLAEAAAVKDTVTLGMEDSRCGAARVSMGAANANASIQLQLILPI